MGKDQAEAKQSKVKHTIRYLVAAISFVILIIFGIEGYQFYKLSPDLLYAEKYIPYDLARVDSSPSSIVAAYGKKNFSEVIRLNAISVLTARDIFLTGLAYLETGDNSRAISSFQVALIDMKADNKKNTDTMADTVEYYLALAFLKNRDFDQAIELMTSIHNNKTHYYKDQFSNSYLRRVKKLKWR